MSNEIKNPTEQKNNTEPNDLLKNKQGNGNEKNNSQEVDLPTPEKKNDDITTGVDGENPDENTGQTGQKPAVKNDDKDLRHEKDEKGKTGFDPNNATEPARKDKRGDETERLEKDDTTDPKTKDADWQQDKMNEANNQQGSKKNIDTSVK